MLRMFNVKKIQYVRLQYKSNVAVTTIQIAQWKERKNRYATTSFLSAVHLYREYYFNFFEELWYVMFNKLSRKIVYV